MRTHFTIVALLACASVPITGQTGVTSHPSADEVITEMSTRQLQREPLVGGYVGTRQYDLENHLLTKRAHLIAAVTCEPDGAMHYQIVSKEGWNAGNNALRQALETESQVSRPSVRPMTLITKDNYGFQMIGTLLLNGRTVYVIDVVPKRQEVYLFRGRIWVDAEDYALTRVEGQLAKTPSYWIRSVHFTLEFQKNGEYWFPSLSTSTSEVRIFGPTDVKIRFLDYSPLSAAAEKHSGLSSMEASYVKH
jgi:hypothetical protein